MSDFRVIYHARACPDCGSLEVTERDLDLTDGTTETALICQDCGAAWPVACIAEALQPILIGPAPFPHLSLRIDGKPPATPAADRCYWCPRCDTYLTGTDLAAASLLHYTPGPDRAITRRDLTPAPRS